MIQIKRIYEAYTPNDEVRVLVDRLWPRGVSKEEAHIDFWLKDIAPSNELRTWFSHDPKKWDAFKKKYQEEIQHNKEAFAEIKKIVAENKKVTLVYAAKDEEHNNAVVLQELL